MARGRPSPRVGRISVRRRSRKGWPSYKADGIQFWASRKSERENAGPDTEKGFGGDEVFDPEEFPKKESGDFRKSAAHAGEHRNTGGSR